MNYWSNIPCSPEDPEIIQINGLEISLGELPDNVLKVRELITRFEVCHFKYQTHLKKIKDSIEVLKPVNDPSKIGINHPQYGESVWKNDKTGRSYIGQQYIWALKNWIGEKPGKDVYEEYNRDFGHNIASWLGEKNTEKLRLVKFLLARLSGDWKAYEELQHGGEFEKLEYQIARMDICHYAFPSNLDLVIQGIEKMQPISESEFEGCGTFNEGIKVHLKKEFENLNKEITIIAASSNLEIDEKIQLWLTMCLAKTIKEAMYFSDTVSSLDYNP